MGCPFCGPLVVCRKNSGAGGHIFPAADVSHTLVVTRYHNFLSHTDFNAFFTANRARAARALLFKNHFARSLMANGAADFSQDPGHLEIFGIEREVMRHENFGHEQKHNACARKSGQGGQAQTGKDQKVEVHEQVAGPAEPCEKNGDGKRTEKREVLAAMGTAVSSGMEMTKPGEMDVQRATEKCNRSKGKTDDEADEIEIFEGHLSLSHFRNRAFAARFQHMQQPVDQLRCLENGGQQRETPS